MLKETFGSQPHDAGATNFTCALDRAGKKWVLKTKVQSRKN